MWPIRKNFYNENIYMIHQEKLLSIIDEAKDPSLRKYIRDLLEKYHRERHYLNDIPHELRGWPNCYIGFSRSDEINSLIIDLAIQDSKNDTIWLNDDYLIYACGVAFLQEEYELASELSKIKSLSSSSVTIKNILQVVSEDTLNYLLTYIQTENKVTKDKKIVFCNGEKYVALDTTLPLNYINENTCILKYK